MRITEMAIAVTKTKDVADDLVPFATLAEQYDIA